MNRDNFSRYIEDKSSINFGEYPHKLCLSGDMFIHLKSNSGKNHALKVIKFIPYVEGPKAINDLNELDTQIYNKSLFEYHFKHNNRLVDSN